MKVKQSSCCCYCWMMLQLLVVTQTRTFNMNALQTNEEREINWWKSKCHEMIEMRIRYTCSMSKLYRCSIQVCLRWGSLLGGRVLLWGWLEVLTETMLESAWDVLEVSHTASTGSATTKGLLWPVILAQASWWVAAWWAGGLLDVIWLAVASHAQGVGVLVTTTKWESTLSLHDVKQMNKRANVRRCSLQKDTYIEFEIQRQYEWQPAKRKNG